MDISIGNSVSIKATARATPAGLAFAALLVSSVVVPLVWLAGKRARERRRVG